MVLRDGAACGDQRIAREVQDKRYPPILKAKVDYPSPTCSTKTIRRSFFVGILS
jgi:hypothetical protein